MAVNRPTRRGSDLLDKVALFNKKVEQHNETQLANPFSNVDKGSFSVKKMDKNDPNYGRYDHFNTAILHVYLTYFLMNSVVMLSIVS